MSTFVMIVELLGALGVFLFGMKLMSEALQRVAGSRLKRLLGKMTANRFSGVLTGFGVTAIIQSSSATTVMVVSFVTAGLFTLTQAIGVIMGANIGTTVTGWIVSLIGFKVKIKVLALPAVGAGVAMTFLRSPKAKHWGEVLVGFGLLFLGLGLMKHSVPTISDPTQLAWIKSLTGAGMLSAVAFVALGTILTVILQSSSATMTLTLTLAAMGWIPYPMAAAMILGENIGTTATANIAAIGAPTAAVRAARVHLLFNVFGVIWALLLMHVYWLPVVDWLVQGDPNIDFRSLQGNEQALAEAASVVTVHLAAAHTLFNVTNTAIMLPFVSQLEKLVTLWVPDREEREHPTTSDVLREAGTGTFIETPELNMVQARKALVIMTAKVRAMLRDAMHIFSHPNEDLGPMVKETLSHEQEIDDLERQVQHYITRVAETELSEEASQEIAALLQNAHRIERIADHCAVLVRIARRIHNAGTPFSQEAIADLEQLYEKVCSSLDNVMKYLDGKADAAAGEAIEDEIDTIRRKLRAKCIRQIESGEARRTTALAFLDVIAQLEEIGDRAVGIVRRTEQVSASTS